MGGITPVLSKGLGLVNTLSGGVLPFVGAATQALGTIGAVQEYRQNRAQGALEVRQLQQRQALEQSQLEAEAAYKKQTQALETAQAQEERRAALKRAVARQRASFGAQGVGSAGGSSQAVLLGLFEESEDERKKREALDALRSSGLDSAVNENRASNLLAYSQAAERKHFSNIYG